MKKVVALILALVMVLSLAAVAFAEPINWMDTKKYDYNENPHGSLARIVVNTVTHLFGDKNDHVIGHVGVDQLGIAAFYDDTVNDIAYIVCDVINSVANHISRLCGPTPSHAVNTLIAEIRDTADFARDVIAFVWSINGLGIKQNGGTAR